MTVYEYLPHRYANPSVTDAALRFPSLLSSPACRAARRDELEGTHPYEPAGSLSD